MEAFNSALEFLQGGSVNAVKAMRQEMNEASENLEFEKAAYLRDRIKELRDASH